jgi:hypothetical protein
MDVGLDKVERERERGEVMQRSGDQKSPQRLEIVKRFHSVLHIIAGELKSLLL